MNGKLLRMLVVAALGAGTMAAQGCVALPAYEAVKRENDALRRAYEAGNAGYGRIQRELELARSQLKGKDAEIEAMRHRLGTADVVFAGEKLRLEDKYRRMIEEMRAQGTGADLSINPKTGGAVLENDIFFAAGRADLKPEKLRVLDDLVARLSAGDFAAAEIEIAGHTDVDPIKVSKWADNYQLSCERARNVRSYFVSRGVSPERVHISGFGPNKPRSEKKSENRRVEVVLHER